jgi:hypothetical protein
MKVAACTIINHTDNMFMTSGRITIAQTLRNQNILWS